MTIIRTFHDKSNPYTVLNNQVLFDNTLSNAARGLWAQCMARKDDWVFYMSEMTNNTKDGETAISSQINELIRAGYVARLRIMEKRDGKLLYKSVEYIFFESKLTDEKKIEFLNYFKNKVDHCYFLEPVPTKYERLKSKCEHEFKNKLPQPGFPNLENPELEKTPLLNTEGVNTDLENTIIAPPLPASSPKQPPAVGNNNLYSSLSICDDLSDRQKRLLMKYPEKLVDRAVKYAYHPTTKINGGPIGRLKLLQYFLKNPDDFKDTEQQIDNPEPKLTKKERLVGKFKRGDVYNGFEYFQDNIGIGFLRADMPQPYSVRWDSVKFEEELIAILKKCKIE